MNCCEVVQSTDPAGLEKEINKAINERGSKYKLINISAYSYETEFAKVTKHVATLIFEEKRNT